MINDFYTNLTTITNNLEDITFTKYATITNLNNDGTCTAKEDEEDGLTHENVLTLSHNLQVGDKVVLGFVDNSIYNPVILTGGEEAYTKTETDNLLQKIDSKLDDIYDTFLCENLLFDESDLLGGS